MIGWATEELTKVLARLSPQQARGVVRIVEAELAGRPFESLFLGADKVCSRATYHGRKAGEGWKHKDAFIQALDLARRDYRAWMLEQGTGEALALLAQTAPEAVRALKQQVAGDQAALEALSRVLGDSNPALRRLAADLLGATELSMTTPALEAALALEKDDDVRKALVGALGRVARSTDGARRSAATSLLDRGDVKTARKQAVAMETDIDAAIEAELAIARQGVTTA